jgi:hypothetical protein
VINEQVPANESEVGLLTALGCLGPLLSGGAEPQLGELQPGLAWAVAFSSVCSLSQSTLLCALLALFTLSQYPVSCPPGPEVTSLSLRLHGGNRILQKQQSVRT